MSDRLVCASHLSTLPDGHAALDEACASVRAALGEREPTLVVAFTSTHHATIQDELPARVTERLGCAHLIGCTGEGVIGRGREIEEEPALSLWAAHIPGLEAHPFHVRFEQRDDDLAIHGWPEPIKLVSTPTVLLLADPFSSAPPLLLEQFAEHYPGAPVIGGIASGGQRPGKNRLYLDGAAHDEGAVGLLLWGPLQIDALVSQGCRPIGRHLVITKGRHNVIAELGGKPAFEQFQQIYETLDETDQQLARTALQVGCVINEHQPSFGRGDFLLRNIVGIDTSTGAIMLNQMVRVGQTVQFHVRDAATATEDLTELLERQRAAAGALLFSCNGRGTRLFSRRHHDASAVAERLGDIPLAGFFAQGEIGPVGGRNFLHGFTASIALFGSADAPPASDDTSEPAS